MADKTGRSPRQMMHEWRSGDLALLAGLRRIEKIERIMAEQDAKHRAHARR